MTDPRNELPFAIFSIFSGSKKLRKLASARRFLGPVVLVEPVVLQYAIA